MRDGSFLDQLQRQCLVVELDREDGARRGPCPDHQVVKHLEGSYCVTGSTTHEDSCFDPTKFTPAKARRVKQVASVGNSTRVSKELSLHP